MSKSIKIQIITSIIGSVVVIVFIQPLMNFIWKTVLTVGGAVHEGFVDRLYRAAAISDPSRFTIVVGLAIILFILIFEMQPLLFSPNYEAFSTDRQTNLTKRFLIFIALITVLFIFTLIFGIFDLRMSFTQRLTILAPGITDIEYKTLNAEWVKMKSKADYQAIVATMDKRAAELNITLPPAK